MPSAAPPSAPSTRPSRTSNAIFMAMFRLSMSARPHRWSWLGAAGSTRPRKYSPRVNVIPDSRLRRPQARQLARRGMTGSKGLDRAGLAFSQNRGDVAFKHLLNQIEGIHDLADLRDVAVAKRVKNRDVELHDPVVAALAEEHANMRRDLVAFRDNDGHVVAHAGIAGVDGLPHLPDLGLAMAVAQMRQDIDRRVGDEIDVVAAAGQCALDAAGIIRIEQI